MPAHKHTKTQVMLLILVAALTACTSHPVLETTIEAPTPASSFSDPKVISPTSVPANIPTQINTSQSTTEASTAPLLSSAVRAAPHVACTTPGYEGRIFSIFWSPNSSVLAARSEAGLCLYDVVANQAVLAIDAQSIESGSFSPDGKLLAVGYFNSPAQLWDVATGRILYALKTEMKQGRALTFSPDGRLLAYGEQTAEPDCRVEVWDVTQQRALHTLSEAGGVSSVWQDLDFAPDGKILAVGSNYPPNLVQLWDMTTGQLIRNLPIEGTITDVSFAADGKTLVARSYWYSKYEESHTFVKLWDVATGRELNSLEADSSTYLGPLSKDQHMIFSQGDSAQLVNLKAPNEIKLLGYKSGSAMAFAPDSRILAFITDEAVTLWDVNTDQPLRTFATGLAPGYSIFSPNGRLLAVKSSNIMTVKVWDIESGREVFVLAR